MSDQATPKAAFEPFHWLVNFDHTGADTLLEQTQDIALGIKLLLQICESDELAIDEQEPTLLERNEHCTLMRMAIASADLLAKSAGTRIDWTNDKRLGRQWVPHGPK